MCCRCRVLLPPCAHSTRLCCVATATVTVTFRPSPQRMLDMEYEECVKATKGYNIEDYDQGPVGDDEQQQDEPPAPAATAGGYAAFGGSVGRTGAGLDDTPAKGAGAQWAEYWLHWQCADTVPFSLCAALLHSFARPSDHRGDAPARSSMPLEGGGDEEWSEAWAEYKRECAEEAAEAAAAGITDADVANQTAPNPEPQKPAPLSDGPVHAHPHSRVLLAVSPNALH